MTHLTLTAALWIRYYYYSHNLSEETEVGKVKYKSKVILFVSVESLTKHRKSDFKVIALNHLNHDFPYLDITSHFSGYSLYCL